MGVKAQILSLIRRGRPVAWVPEFMRLGNLLYVGRWAHDQPKRRILLHPSRREALQQSFPNLIQRYFIEHREVRFTDQRVMPWREDSDPSDNSSTALASYVNDILLPGSPVLLPAGPPEGALVINVRRGDYYSVDVHRKEFGIPVRRYVERAVTISINRSGLPKSLHVISDDVSWCRDQLGGWLSGIAPVAYGRGGPVEDLAALVRAERLVLANSTFSYWGGLIGDQLSPGREVLVPWMFARSMDDGSCRALVSPEWTVVNLEGGWPVPEASPPTGSAEHSESIR